MNQSSRSKKIDIDCDNVIQIENNIETAVEDSYQLKVQIVNVLRQRDSRWIIFLISCNSIVVYYLWHWSLSINSVALKAYVNTVVFNVCALAVCLISIWVEQNTQRQSHDGFEYATRSFKFRSAAQQSYRGLSLPVHLKTSAPSITVLGLEKYEVLALLLSSCFVLLTELGVLLEALARIKGQRVVHEGRLGLGAVLGLLTHLVTILAYPDASLNHVVCKALPCPTLKGANPILAGNLIGFVILCADHVAVHFWDLYTVDTAAAFAVIGLTVASMLPLAFYTASIILQRLSHHMSEQLDKCLREALIIDGVLEFRNERFWTKSFGKLAGSLEVRVRKNADEHYVLERVVKRLSNVVSTLRVQEFREPGFSQKHQRVDELSLEYYVNELLPHPVRQTNVTKKDDDEEEEEEEEEEPRLKIEEILESGSKQETNPMFQSDSCRSVLPSHVNCLFRDIPVARNALLLGNDHLHGSPRLHCLS